jgi:hypothetical protein
MSIVMKKIVKIISAVDILVWYCFGTLLPAQKKIEE